METGPPKRSSGVFRVVQDHARRIAEILQRCDHAHADGRRCTRAVGHDGDHGDGATAWEDREGRWR